MDDKSLEELINQLHEIHRHIVNNEALQNEESFVHLLEFRRAIKSATSSLNTIIVIRDSKLADKPYE